MAKNTIRTYSTTAASNTDVGGVDIQGTAPASNMDDSVREIMSHLAETNAGTAPVDDTWSFCDPADATKIVRLDAGNVTAGQTRVITVPDANITLPNSFATLTSLEGLTLGAGDMLYATAADTLADLAIGTAGQFLVTNAGATAPEWASRPTLVSLEGLSLVAGDTLYATAADTLARLAKGTAAQYYRMNSGATAPEWTSEGLLTSGTAQATTSGTSKDFPSIPSWVKRITISISGLSTNGSSHPIIQIGDSGGIEATGYDSVAGSTSYTTGFGLGNGGASDTTSGVMTLVLQDSATNTWCCGLSAGTPGVSSITGGGAKSLSGALDRVRLTTVNGTDVFDAGKINILYD